MGCTYVFYTGGNVNDVTTIEPNTRIMVPDDTFFQLNNGSTGITIGSGVEFLFGKGAKFGGIGFINANGTDENPITFTSKYYSPDWDQYWGGIEPFVNGVSELTFDYVNISYAMHGFNLHPYTVFPTPLDFPPEISNCSIQSCVEGLRLQDILNGCHISDTSLSDLSGTALSSYNSVVNLTGSTILNTTNGVVIDNSDYWIENNSISVDNIGIGISWSTGRNHHILDNDISDGTTGVRIYNSVAQLGYGAMPEGTENVIENNSDNGLIVIDKSNVKLLRNIIRNNGAEEIVFDHASQPDMDGFVNQIVDDDYYSGPPEDKLLIHCVDHNDLPQQPLQHIVRKNYWGDDGDFGERQFEPGG